MTHIDTTQLRQLIDAHGAALVLYARQWCHAPDDALQEALIDLVRQQPAPETPVAWLYKTVRRRAMNLSRADMRRARHHRQASAEREPWFQPSSDSSDEPLDIEALLTQLSSQEREIVVARIWGALSLQQVAELVGSSTSAVHRRYQQALRKLGREIESQQVSQRREDATRTTEFRELRPGPEPT